MAIKRPGWMPSAPVFVASVLLLSAYDYMAWSICVDDVSVVDAVMNLMTFDNGHPPSHTDESLSSTFGGD